MSESRGAAIILLALVLLFIVVAGSRSAGSRRNLGPKASAGQRSRSDAIIDDAGSHIGNGDAADVSGGDESSGGDGGAGDSGGGGGDGGGGGGGD